MGVAAPVGTLHGTHRHSRLPRARQPRPRTCLRKGCGGKYQPQCWNQRYCQDRECLREVRRWQAARRQAERRRDARVNARHAQAEKERRQRAKVAPKAIENPEVAPARGHAANFPPPLSLCDRPGCYEPPVISLRNPARFCCAACRQAVRNVLDRERKWLLRGSLDDQETRAIEFGAARPNRFLPQ